jgi:tRNA A-37 threonylcarbamoyl transferase component Bud32
MAGDEAFAVRQECLAEDEALAYVSSAASAERDVGLEKHVDSCNPCRLMLAEAARAMSESGLAPARTGDFPEVGRRGRAATPTSLAVGEVLLSRYTIVRFVARGGMGEVYEAYDDVLGETVALKTLVCTDLDRPAAMQRLMAEVRLARQVTHPNVCRIYEFGMHLPHGRPGRDEEQVPFLTMEFLQGETLDRRLVRSGPLAPTDVARLIPHMTAGLGAIHAAGIIHRDIKPANMSLLPGPPERLVLMDFGLARSVNPIETSLSLSGGRLVGTIDYMAPEQVGGLPVTRSIDIYALGLVIFEMLTGRRPFAGTDALSTAVGRMIAPPPKPTGLVPGLDPAWDTLIARCLAVEPARRFASADEIVAFVAANLTAQSRARRRWLPGKAGVLAAVSRPRYAVAAVAAVAVIGVLAIEGVRRRSSRPVTMGSVGAAGAVTGPKAPLRADAKRPQRSFLASGCSPDMVRVADQFCIDRFEAAAIDDLGHRALSTNHPPSQDMLTKVFEEWDRRVEGGTTGLPVPLPALPDWQRQYLPGTKADASGWRPVAVSQPGVTPQGYASQIIAAVACAGAGKRLCTTQEWRTACRGDKDTQFPYGPTYQPDACNVGRSEHPAEMLKIDYTDGLHDPRMNQMTSQTSGPLLRTTGASPACASRWGDDAVYDMVGNLEEWSSDPNGVLLGGFYSRQTQDGCDFTNTKHGPDFFNYALGIRCCDKLR